MQKRSRSSRSHFFASHLLFTLDLHLTPTPTTRAHPHALSSISNNYLQHLRPVKYPSSKNAKPTPPTPLPTRSSHPSSPSASFNLNLKHHGRLSQRRSPPTSQSRPSMQCRHYCHLNHKRGSRFGPRQLPARSSRPSHQSRTSLYSNDKRTKPRIGTCVRRHGRSWNGFRHS